jgi:hypothetical protein
MVWWVIGPGSVVELRKARSVFPAASTSTSGQSDVEPVWIGVPPRLTALPDTVWAAPKPVEVAPTGLVATSTRLFVVPPGPIPTRASTEYVRAAAPEATTASRPQ